MQLPPTGNDSVLHFSSLSEEVNNLAAAPAPAIVNSRKWLEFGDNYDITDFTEANHLGKKGIWRLKPVGEGRFVASVSYDGYIRLYDVLGKPFTSFTVLEKKNNQQGKAFSPVEKKDHPYRKAALDVIQLSPTLIAGGGHGGVVTLFDLSKRSVVKICPGFVHGVYSLAHLQEKKIAIGSCDMPQNAKNWKFNISIHDFDADKPHTLLEGHEGSIPQMEKVDPHHLISCSADHTVRVWDLPTTSCIQVFKPHKDYIYTLCKVKEAVYVTGSKDRTLGMIDIRQKSSKNLEGHESTVYSVVHLGDDVVASVSRDKSVKIWDLRAEKKVVKTLNDSKQILYSIAKLPDGSILTGNDVGHISKFILDK